MNKPIFITAIDTDAGKTYATGLLAKYLQDQGCNVITQKLSQTGCKDTSEDIEMHRKLMGIPMQEADRSGLTCPYIFDYPASPELSASLEGKVIDPMTIKQATDQLTEQYEQVIIEGVGGLYVPLNAETTVLDYLQAQDYPTVLVSSAKLGSINHSLMSLEIAKQRGLNIRGIIYNRIADHTELIAEDTRRVLLKYLKQFGFPEVLIEIPKVDENGAIPAIDFSPLIQS
ncbi:dethiobiotin synthase [Persicobacter psychrovividus]|uniref:ATP-dependent dethiobiotin synthetase BioD n=1 Tax=Persicobacter psychrovividus TaxID=387638 RepID=A0ABM7VND7_9BACT|nr:ATP-dependent dethiobiotin synthetase BioD [Persicobacter psychrovividus]